MYIMYSYIKEHLLLVITYHIAINFNEIRKGRLRGMSPNFGFTSIINGTNIILFE